MRPRVFVSAPLPGDAVASLGEIAEVDVGHERVGVAHADFEARAGDYEAVVTLLTDRVDAALLARMPRLRVVANVAVGVDNIDVAACRARGVVVTSTPGVLTEATADLAFGLILAAARRIAEGDRLVRAGQWTGWSPSLLLGARVHGSVLGIVGLGRIGQALARRARGFGMHVLYTPRSLLGPLDGTPPLPERDVRLTARALGAEEVPLDELFARADIVSLHCPLTPETRGLVSAERLAQMKPGSILVNTARGACVDEAALAVALSTGPLAAAGLDVFVDEPRVHPALLGLPNVVLLPHIASADRPTREAMARMAVQNARAVLEGKPAPNAIT